MHEGIINTLVIPIESCANTSGRPRDTKKLNVDDALKYLDLVKSTFASQPKVYNDFLDIMKEFKSQIIDTQGVIKRVSTLFKEHQALIVGFNLFLHPGYKINMDLDSNGCRISLRPPSSCSSSSDSDSDSNSSSNCNNVLTLTALNDLPESAMRSIPELTYENTPPMRCSRSPPPERITRPLRPAAVWSHRQPEFNSAVHYVNKIKDRFVNKPEYYTEFLSILQSFQKNQKKIKDSGKSFVETELYKRITKIFENDEDLLEEFSHFLPADAQQSELSRFKERKENNHGSMDTSSQPLPSPGSFELLTHSLNVYYSYYNPAPTESTDTSVVTCTSDNQKTTPTETPYASGCITASRINTEQGIAVKQYPSARPILNECNDKPAVKRQKLQKTSPSSSKSVVGNHTSSKRDKIFYKIRRALKYKDSYENFLRCVVLFNEGIVSGEELIAITKPFFCNYPVLFKRFKNTVRGGPSTRSTNSRCLRSVQPDVNEVGEGGDSSIASRGIGRCSNGVKVSKRRESCDSEPPSCMDLSECKSIGASYRRLPLGYVSARCSGRSSLCNNILNDDVVLWTGDVDESNWTKTKKTRFEEAMFSIEDERFELDIVIEMNSSTIRIFEGVSRNIQTMTPLQLARFKLDDKLGGSSAVHQKQALQRIYGSMADNIIGALKTNPSVVLPIVLKRLKDKDKEWREAKKGFNKVWREEVDRRRRKLSESQTRNNNHYSSDCDDTDIEVLKRYCAKNDDKQKNKFGMHTFINESQNGCDNTFDM